MDSNLFKRAHVQEHIWSAPSGRINPKPRSGFHHIGVPTAMMSEIGPFVRPYMRPRFPAEGNCQISNSGLRLQPICSCLGLVSLKITCSRLARE
jgi:hypothetical protein